MDNEEFYKRIKERMENKCLKNNQELDEVFKEMTLGALYLDKNIKGDSWILSPNSEKSEVVSRFIDNPFKNMFSDKDVQEIKEEFSGIIDTLHGNSKDKDLIEHLLDELDDIVMDLIMLARFNDAEKIEVVRVSDVPTEVLEDLEISYSDEESFIPLDMLPPDSFKK